MRDHITLFKVGSSRSSCSSSSSRGRGRSSSSSSTTTTTAAIWVLVDPFLRCQKLTAGDGNESSVFLVETLSGPKTFLFGFRV